MPEDVCEICGEEDVKVYECIRCGIFFCEECGSVSDKLCILCTSEEEYEDEEEYEEGDEEYDEEFENEETGFFVDEADLRLKPDYKHFK